MTTPRIEVSSKEKTDAIVLGWFQKSQEKDAKKEDKKARKADSDQSLPQPEYLGKAGAPVDALKAQLKESDHFHGKKNDTSLLRYYGFGDHKNTLLLGLGLKNRFSAEVSREAGAAVQLAQRKERLGSATVDTSSVFAGIDKAELPYYVQAFCEGYLLAGYRYHELKTQLKPGSEFHPKLLQFAGIDKTLDLASAVKRATLLSRSVNFARSLGDMPSNYLTPSGLADQVAKMAKEVGVSCTIFNKARIQREKMGLLLGVSQGSAEEPRFIILEYRGGKRGDAPIALVGKGVTFDTGGISLKPAARMEEMKYDMMGAATVAGSIMAAALLKLPVNVVGYIAAAENMPGGRAQKPGDVMRSLSGKTVEITNTDAEGRLLLADAIEYAQKFEPQAIIDFATLTGAVVVALGSTVTGIMGNSKALMGRMEESAKVTGERVWRLPLYDEFDDFFRSPVADFTNSSEVREAGSSKGGTFLKFFVKKDVPWVHCDIAGSGMLRNDRNYIPKRFASGAMIRLTAHLLEHWKPVNEKS